MNINFFWAGDDFQFLNRLTIASHIAVGHKVKIWLAGDTPKSKYWINDFKEVEILNADDIFKGDTPKTPREGRVFSDLWSFHFLSQTGEYYADTDAIAISSWPDKEIVLATYGDPIMAIGVIRLPKNHPVLDYCIMKHKGNWGAVNRFTRYCKKFDLKPTVPNWMFYPILLGKYNDSEVMKCKGKILDPISEDLQKKIDKGCVSIHYYSNKVSKVGITHEWMNIPKLKNSLLVSIDRDIQRSFTWSHTNEGKL